LKAVVILITFQYTQMIYEIKDEVKRNLLLLQKIMN